MELYVLCGAEGARLGQGQGQRGGDRAQGEQRSGPQAVSPAREVEPVRSPRGWGAKPRFPPLRGRGGHTWQVFGCFSEAWASSPCPPSPNPSEGIREEVRDLLPRACPHPASSRLGARLSPLRTLQVWPGRP